MINVIYNDTNKTVLKVLNLPWIVSCLQLGIALPIYVFPMWLSGLRKAPKLSMANVRTILPQALIHGIGQCVTVMSLGAGSLAFVNVVKSLEPLFNVVFGAIFMNDVLPWQASSAAHHTTQRKEQPSPRRRILTLCADACLLLRRSTPAYCPSSAA